MLFLVGVLLLHLLLDEITDGGRTRGRFSRFGANTFQRLLVVFNVLGLHRQVDNAVLAVDADDLRFNFVAFVQRVACVFNTVTADFRSFQ